MDVSFDVEKDYYAVLHLDRHASPADVKKAFFTMAKKYHPDTKKSLHDADVEEVFTEKYREVNEAHRVLNDPLVRRDYDRARDLRELGSAAPAPSQPSSPVRQPSPADGLPRELPPVIRSDRGAVFVRPRGRASYIGEDGASYDVTEDGRIRRLADPGLMGTMQRYAVTGTPGEVVVGWFGRILLRLVLVIAKALAAVLVNYPLFLSMTVVHPNVLRRLPQERAFIGPLSYALFTFVNLLALIGCVLLGVLISPILTGVGLALHLIAASLLALDLRAPYLRLLDSAGVAAAVGDGAAGRRVRRGIAILLYVLQLSAAAWGIMTLTASLPANAPAAQRTTIPSGRIPPDSTP